MNLEAQPAGGHVPEPDAYIGAGGQLKAAREAAGLSLDQVAQQLKLAPRQVRALEEENFGMLPGRTFTRGFMRNYARLLSLDPDLLVAHLPDAAHAPSLEPPPLHSTGTTMAELPTAHAHTPSFGRWHAETISAADRSSIYIPAGCAHGFQTLVDNTELSYDITPAYVAEAGRGIAFDDPEFAIAWPLHDATLSQEYRQRPGLAAAQTFP